MTELLGGFGVHVGDATAIYILCTAYILVAITIIWVIGLFLGDHSCVDCYYGWSYASIGWIAYLISTSISTYAAILLIMSTLHGVRLGYYLSKRWAGLRRKFGGDKRYMGFVTQFAPGYWWKSFFIVMHSQSVLILVVALPVVYGIVTTKDLAAPLGPLAFVGIAVFGIGLYYEWLGDGQLESFKADPANAGRYLETGVWRVTRHPNYFGNSTVWWGIWIVAVAGNPGIWWTIVSPLLNTFMLTKLLGSAFADKYMGDRPAYQQLMSRRSAFWPRFG